MVYAVLYPSVTLTSPHLFSFKEGFMFVPFRGKNVAPIEWKNAWMEGFNI